MRTSTLPLTLLLLSLVGCDPSASSQAGGLPLIDGRHYVIQPGDTLYDIARRAYGDPLRWFDLAEANRWIVDPERLIVGDRVFVPAVDGGRSFLNVDQRDVGYDPDDSAPPRTMRPADPASSMRLSSANPGTAEPAPAQPGIRAIFRNISSTSFMGQPIQRLGVLAIAGFFAHALIQGFILWLIATITFVPDVTLKKTLRASLHTGFITLVAVLVTGGTLLLMFHIGTNADGATLASTVESYLRHPVTLVIGGLSVFALYVLLCLRFVPASLGLKRVQATAIIFLGVLAPHLAAMFLIGQRLGLVKF